jgi:hypothetical protein
MKKTNAISVRRMTTTDTLTLIIAGSGSTLNLHKAARAWMSARADQGRRVYGVRLVPFGIEFDRRSWREKDIEAVAKRLGIRLD